jgi:hypothetical protein
MLSLLTIIWGPPWCAIILCRLLAPATVFASTLTPPIVLIALRVTHLAIVHLDVVLALIGYLATVQIVLSLHHSHVVIFELGLTHLVAPPVVCLLIIWGLPIRDVIALLIEV